FCQPEQQCELVGLHAGVERDGGPAANPVRIASDVVGVAMANGSNVGQPVSLRIQVTSIPKPARVRSNRLLSEPTGDEPGLALTQIITRDSHGTSSLRPDRIVAGLRAIPKLTGHDQLDE